MNVDKSLQDFCYSHNIKVLDTNKRAHVYNKINLQYFADPDDYNWIKQDIIRDTEPVYTIEITKSELEKIAAFESQVFNHMKQKGHYDMFNAIMEQKEREKFLKEKYSAVKKAYEQYSLMLKMAESGEL